MLIYSWILIIGVPFVIINEAVKPAGKPVGKAAGKQKRITRHHTTAKPVSKSGIHKSVKNNGSKTWSNRTLPPFRLYQKSGKTPITLKPWNEAEKGKLENGTMTFYNRLLQSVTIYELKHYIYQNDQPIYSEKFQNIVIQRARLTGDIPFHYHPSDNDYQDYWMIHCIYDGRNRTSFKDKCLYNIGPGPGAILFISFQKHQPTGLSFRRVGANEATFAMKET